MFSSWSTSSVRTYMDPTLDPNVQILYAWIQIRISPGYKNRFRIAKKKNHQNYRAQYVRNNLQNFNLHKNNQKPRSDPQIWISWFWNFLLKPKQPGCIEKFFWMDKKLHLIKDLTKLEDHRFWIRELTTLWWSFMKKLHKSNKINCFDEKQSQKTAKLMIVDMAYSDCQKFPEDPPLDWVNLCPIFCCNPRYIGGPTETTMKSISEE